MKEQDNNGATGERNDTRGQAPHSSYYTSPYGGGPVYYGGPASEELSGELSLQRLIAMFLRKWYIFAGMLVVALVVAGVYIKITPKTYKARCLIEVQSRRPRIMRGDDAVIESGTSSESLIASWLAKVRTSAVLDAVLEDLHAIRADDGLPGGGLRARVRVGVSFNRDRKSTMVTLSFSDTDPGFARDAATAYARGIRKESLQANRALSENAIVWLQTQAETQRKQLAKAETAIATFRVDQNVGQLDEEKKLTQEELGALNASLVETDQERGRMANVRDFLGKLTFESLTPAALPPETPHAERITAAWESWRAGGADAAAQRTVELELERAIAAATNTITFLESRSTSLRAELAQRWQSLAKLEATIADKQSRLSALEREREAGDSAYRGILKRIEEARLSADENTTMVEVVEEAALPGRPVSPRPVRVFTLAVFLSLMLGAGLAVVLEILGDQVSGVRDVESSLRLRVLAVIPHAGRAERPNLGKLTFERPNGLMAEAFASIRTLLDSPGLKDASHAILVTSTEPGSGKTITACNLAISFAETGSRTLLVDLDMRRPRIGSVFDVPEEAESIFHCLSEGGDADAFAKLPVKSQCQNLDIIVSRLDPKLSAAEIIGGKNVAAFMEWARSNYERVVIDSPPHGVVSDAAALGGLADGVILVCRSRRCRKRAAQHSIRRLEDIGATMLGAVMNDVKFGVSGIGYHSSYAYRGGKYSKTYYTSETKRTWK